MRKLNSQDMFNALRLTKSLDVKNIIKSFYEETKGLTKDNEEEKGMNIIALILENVASNNVENDLYTFLAGPLETNANDIAKLTPVELINSIKSIIDNESQEDWQSFLNSLVNMMHLKFKR